MSLLTLQRISKPENRKCTHLYRFRLEHGQFLISDQTQVSQVQDCRCSMRAQQNDSTYWSSVLAKLINLLLVTAFQRYVCPQLKHVYSVVYVRSMWTIYEATKSVVQTYSSSRLPVVMRKHCLRRSANSSAVRKPPSYSSINSIREQWLIRLCLHFTPIQCILNQCPINWKWHTGNQVEDS